MKIYKYIPTYFIKIMKREGRSMDYEHLKARFLSLYANVPEPLREQIISVVDSETYSWYTAKAEILNNTKISKKILLNLARMKVI